MFDGPLAIDSARTGKHCGSSVPGPLLSTGTDMVLHFVTDSSVHVEGFDITYVASQSGCGGTITSITGGFASPTARDPGKFSLSTLIGDNAAVTVTVTVTFTYCRNVSRSDLTFS